MQIINPYSAYTIYYLSACLFLLAINCQAGDSATEEKIISHDRHQFRMRSSHKEPFKPANGTSKLRTAADFITSDEDIITIYIFRHGKCTGGVTGALKLREDGLTYANELRDVLISEAVDVEQEFQLWSIIEPTEGIDETCRFSQTYAPLRETFCNYGHPVLTKESLQDLMSSGILLDPPVRMFVVVTMLFGDIAKRLVEIGYRPDGLPEVDKEKVSNFADNWEFSLEDDLIRKTWSSFFYLHGLKIEISHGELIELVSPSSLSWEALRDSKTLQVTVLDVPAKCSRRRRCAKNHGSLPR